MKSRKAIICIIAVVLLLTAVVLFFAIKNRDDKTGDIGEGSENQSDTSMDEDASKGQDSSIDYGDIGIDMIVVDRFKDPNIIVCTETSGGRAPLLAVFSENTKNYNEFTEIDDIVGRKIVIYTDEETLAIYPAYTGVSKYELGEMADDEEMEAAMAEYDELKDLIKPLDQ